MTATVQGMTREQALHLLNTISSPCVRVPAKYREGGKSKRHHNTAQLLRVDGDYAIIKPSGHGKEEKVPLSVLSEWKSMNYSKQATMQGRTSMKSQSPTVSHNSNDERATKAHNHSEKTTFVAFSEKQGGMYSATKGWTTNEHFASKYDDISNARRASTRLQRRAGCEDTRAIALSGARAKAVQLCSQSQTQSISDNLAQAQQVVETKEVPDTSHDIVQTWENNPDKENVDINHFLSMDLDSLASVDLTKIQEAIDKRKKAIEDIKETKAMMLEAIRQFHQSEQDLKNALNQVNQENKQYNSNDSNPVSPQIQSQENRDSVKQRNSNDKKVNHKTVPQVIEEILTKDPRSMTQVELRDKLLEFNLTNSARPKNVLYVTVNNLVRRGVIGKDGNDKLYWIGKKK